MNATTCKICNSNESLVLPTDEVCAFVRFLMIPNLHLTTSNTVCDDCVNVIKRQTIFRYILNDIEGNLKNDDQNISIDIDKLCGITPENLNSSFEKRLCRTCLNIAERYTPLVGSLQEIFSKCLDLEPQKTVNPVVCNECVVLLEEFNTLKCLVDSNNKQIQKCDEEANGKHSEAIENDMIEILDDESKFIKIDSDLGAKCMIKCKYCKEFIYEINLKTHYNTCEELPFEANDEKFRCRYCLFETQDVAQIDGHLTYCHSYTQSKIKGSVSSLQIKEISSSDDASANISNKVQIISSIIVHPAVDDNNRQLVTDQILNNESPDPIEYDKRKFLRVLKCNFCSFNTRKIDKLEHHLTLEYTKDQTESHNCCVIFSQLNDKKKMYDHLKNNRLLCCYQYFYWCVDCTTLFRRIDDVILHTSCYKKDTNFLFKSNGVIFCLLCDEETVDRQSAFKHQRMCLRKFTSNTQPVDIIQLD